MNNGTFHTIETKDKMRRRATGRVMSDETKKKIGESCKRVVPRGINHYAWKEEKSVERKGYWGLHKWISRKFGRPQECTNCHTLTSKKYEWANISGNYIRNISDWIRLCTKCHVNYDRKNLTLTSA